MTRCVHSHRIAIATLIAALSLVPIAARAESINGCIDTCVDTFSGENQWELEQNCMNNCRNRVNYGAIAYDTGSGAWGDSYDYHSTDDANQRALSDCSREGPACKVVISFSETCAALAAGDNSAWAANVGDGVGDARHNALVACARNGGRNCAIKVSTCARD